MNFYNIFLLVLQDYLGNEINNNLYKYGPNQLNKSKQKKWYNYLWLSFFSPFNSILISIIFVLIYTDIILSSPPNYANIIVILALIFISTLLDFFEEFSSNKAA